MKAKQSKNAIVYDGTQKQKNQKLAGLEKFLEQELYSLDKQGTQSVSQSQLTKKWKTAIIKSQNKMPGGSTLCESELKRNVLDLRS